jgi:hypothetical protein
MLTGPEALAAASRIAPIYLEGRLLPIQDDVSRSLGLSLHDVVRAMVETRAESLVLNLNGRALTLPHGLNLRPGEEVWLRYLQTKAGAAFQILPQAPAAQTTGAPDQLALAPQQALPLPPVSLAGLLGRPAEFGLLGQLVANSGLFQMARLRPDMIRQALKSSGLFFEAKLAQGQPTVGDLKASLQVMLARILDEDPDDLEAVERLQAGLRELTHAQVDTVVAAGQRELFLHFLIPFQDAPPADIRFFRPPPSEDTPNPPYTIDIQTQSEALGRLWMTAQVAHAEPADRIEMTMWAERPDVARDARRAASELKDDLADAGLSLTQLTVLEGVRPASLTPTPGSTQRTGLHTVDRTA